MSAPTHPTQSQPTLLAGWVGGSWLVFHFWQLPVAPVVLAVPPDQWGQRPDQAIEETQ